MVSLKINVLCRDHRNGWFTSLRFLHLSGERKDLMEFFDDPKNWGQQTVKIGSYNTYSRIVYSFVTQLLETQ